MTETQVAFIGTVRKQFKGSKYVPSIHDGIMNAAAKWNLNLSTDDGKRFTDFEFQGANTMRLGNRCIKGTTKSNYDDHLRQLWRFCSIKGDYDSMLLLVTPTPKHAPAMKVETIEEFLRFK